MTGNPFAYWAIRAQPGRAVRYHLSVPLSAEHDAGVYQEVLCRWCVGVFSAPAWLHTYTAALSPSLGFCGGVRAGAWRVTRRRGEWDNCQRWVVVG